MTFQDWFDKYGSKYLEHPVRPEKPDEVMKSSMEAAWNGAIHAKATEARKAREAEDAARNRAGGIILGEAIEDGATLEQAFMAAWQSFNRSWCEAQERMVVAAIVAAGYKPLPNKGAPWQDHITAETSTGTSGHGSTITKWKVMIDGAVFGEVWWGIDPMQYPGDLKPKIGVWSKLATGAAERLKAELADDEDDRYW